MLRGMRCLSNGPIVRFRYCGISVDARASLLEMARVTRAKWAAHPKRAAAVVLSEIYSRQQAENPALQPAASELR
jgi:hypothetical protein